MADETVDTPTQEEAMSAYQELLNLAPEVEMADPREGTYNGVQIKGAEADFAGSVPRVKITFTGMTDQEDKDFEHTASFSSVVEGMTADNLKGMHLGQWRELLWNTGIAPRPKTKGQEKAKAISPFQAEGDAQAGCEIVAKALVGRTCSIQLALKNGFLNCNTRRPPRPKKDEVAQSASSAGEQIE